MLDEFECTSLQDNDGNDYDVNGVKQIINKDREGVAEYLYRRAMYFPYKVKSN